MEKINKEEFNLLKENKVITHNCSVKMDKSVFAFEGKGNIIYFNGCTDESVVKLKDTRITCLGDNNLIFINSSGGAIKVKIRVSHACNIFIGENVKTPSPMPVSLISNERSNIHIGSNCLFARDIFIRTSDMHMIYDIKTKCRINKNQDVYIGDHVWIGQNVSIMKGAVIGNGSVVGNCAVCTGTKTSKVNSIYVGSPAKLVKEGIFWSLRGTNKTTEKELDEGVFDSISSANDRYDDYYCYDNSNMKNTKAEFDKIRDLRKIEDRISFLEKFSKNKDSLSKPVKANDKCFLRKFIN